MKFRELKADEIECRVGTINKNGCSLLLYKTARTDRALLDENFGDLWQNDFKVVDGKIYGGIGIYNKDLNQWLWRWDCGSETKTEAEKGQASDCFKRAGFKWGIGIELYTAPFIWANVDTVADGDKFKLKNKFQKFFVKDIGYKENKISKLVIVDEKNTEVFEMGKFQKKGKTTEQLAKEIGEDNPQNIDEFISDIKSINTLEDLRAYYKTNIKLFKSNDTLDTAFQARASELKEAV